MDHTDRMGTDTETGPERASIARIDAAGWGVFFVWVGIAMAADLGWSIGLLGIGVIVLASQVVRQAQALPVDRWGVAFGGCLVLAGIWQWLDIPWVPAVVPAWALPAALVALGVAILVRAWNGPRR